MGYHEIFLEGRNLTWKKKRRNKEGGDVGRGNEQFEGVCYGGGESKMKGNILFIFTIFVHQCLCAFYNWGQ